MKPIITRKNIQAFLLFLLINTQIMIGQNSGAVPNRDEIDIKYTWDLSHLYTSDEAWENEFIELGKIENEFSKYEGKLGKNSSNLLGCLQLFDEMEILLDKLWSYASLKSDQDLGNMENQARMQRIRSISTNLSSATAFIEPEILRINDDTLNKYLKKNDELSIYKYHLEDLQRVKKHTLSKEEEKLLALSAKATTGNYKTFSILTNTDFKWGLINDENGNPVEMSPGRYIRYTSSKDRQVRQSAYKELYVPYSNFLNTLTSLLANQLNKNVFYMRARNYESSLKSALDGPNVPTSVYLNLINSVNNNLEPLHRWAELKKDILMVDELHPYDTYAPLFPDVEKLYTYEDAQVLIKDALAPLGEEIIDIIDSAFKERWIDVKENVGKRSGAYSNGVFGVHPYILMNFDGTLKSVSTLAHELGHTVHSYLTNSNQPYVYSSYGSFNAEVASTIHEALLQEYLLDKAETDEERLSLLQLFIENIGSTFYRQVRFAEFELEIYKMAENDEPLTSDSFNKLFGELYSKYWGPSMVVDEEEKLSWSRIPHYYYNYYMYNYATSFAASQSLVKNIKEQGQPAIDRLISFLKSGGSDAPLELLKLAGADMYTSVPIEATAAKMSELLNLMDEILAKNQ